MRQFTVPCVLEASPNGSDQYFLAIARRLERVGPYQ